MKENTYSKRIKCGNCRYGGPIGIEHDIKKGTTVEEFCKKTPCPDCGCFTLHSAWL